MMAKDVMTARVATVRPETPVREIAGVLLKRRISAVPVTDKDGKVVGIVSEGDLMRRKETGTERHSSWWLAFLTLPETDARRFVKSHGQFARDVMTRDVVTVPEDCPLNEVASTLERSHIKRVPVVRGGKIVGIVSRADLVRALATAKPMAEPSRDDRTLREAVEKAIRDRAGGPVEFIGVGVAGGVVHLWGAVVDRPAKDAARVAAQNVPGVRSVEDNVAVLPSNVANLLWAE